MPKVVTPKVQVLKHKSVTIHALRTRSKKDLESEIAQACAEGYTVRSIGRLPNGSVQLEMSLAQSWTVEELLAEIGEMLEAR